MDRLDATPRPLRASRLPVLSKKSSQLFIPPPEAPQRTVPPIPRLSKRSSIASLPRSSKDAPLRSMGASARPASNFPASMRPRTTRTSSLKSSVSTLAPAGDEENVDNLSSLESFRASSRQSSYDDIENGTRGLPAPKVRKSRPSLSDRAMESISAVPTTPKDRRQSNFFSPHDSPMGPPPRPNSVLSNGNGATSRPGTSDGTFVKAAPPDHKTPISAKPLSRTSAGVQHGRKVTSLSKGLYAAKNAKPDLHTTASAADNRITSGISTTSSSALRQQIAAAKAAVQKHQDRTPHDSPRELDNGPAESDVHDPFNQVPKDGKHILRNRIRTARLDGKLNIAALQLKDIPEEVLTMYSSASIEGSNISWAELVDLTKFIAADNELESIADNLFPDLTPDQLQDEEHSQDGQFGGIEMLDLHNNTLVSLPLGLRRLERLTLLNVSHNKLDNTSLDTITQIKTLKELRIGHNSISGTLPSSICTLASLEVLDLQSNRILALPEAIRELVNLRVLQVCANQLTSLPMDAISQLSLHELDASGNALIASLFPLGGGSQHKTLRTLNLANNSLAALTFSPELDMPELQVLDITNNHLTLLPPVHGWQKLVNLAAGDNKIAELPIGFTELKHLRIANLSGNELHILPPEIALMDSLSTLILASNPLRQKKYLTMDAADIKQDLRGFLEGTEVASPEIAAVLSWPLKPGGILDLSGRGLTDSVNDSLGSFLKSNEVRQLNLQDNSLTTIPPALWLGHDLRSLNLSNNPLELDYLSDDLELPSLTELAIATCRITKLEPLLQHLQAPGLRSLQINGNRLSGTVPDLHRRYPELLTLLASDNKFEAVSAAALRGYCTVDLTSNELQSLPAEIGLLWDEGLKSFEVGRNAFRVPGHRVLEKGTQATMRWLKDRIKDTTDGDGDVD